MTQTVTHGQPYTAVFKSAGIGFSDLAHLSAGFPVGVGNVIWYPLGSGIPSGWVAAISTSSGGIADDTLTISGVTSGSIGTHNAMVRDTGNGSTVTNAGTEAGAVFSVV